MGRGAADVIADVGAGPPNGLLGRAEELAELAELLEHSCLVTLTGAPGVGKTRLARELAARHAGRAELVDLAPISDPALLQRALTSALSLQEVPGQTPSETVVAHLRRHPVLLVLDNCEHLIGACGRLVGALLADCPGLVILATSREPLALQGERVWTVPPLAVPDHSDAATPEALMEYSAVRLFVERARAVQPGFALSSYVSVAVAETCRRLDGIPLAIELAAARVDVLTPAEIARRLDDRFDLLTTSDPYGSAHHRTLAAALDWSYGLLSSAERALLRRLAVFVGGFELELAETICASGEVEAGDVQELLAALASKSLVVVDAGACAHPRHRLLETTRAYASDKLQEAGEVLGLREAHARAYLALAERAEPELTGEGQERWLKRLEAERANLHSAFDWSLSQGQSEGALRLTGALVLFWRVRCHFSEGRDLLGAAVAASNGDTTRQLVKALWGVGFMTHMTGDLRAAVPVLEESLAHARELGDLWGQARALLVLGNARQFEDHESALALLEQSATLARQAGDSWCLAHALGVAGHDYAFRHQSAAARPLLEECLAVAREAHDKQGVRFGLLSLGFLAVNQGDYREAEIVLQEALVIADQLGEDYTKAWALQLLVQVAHGRGEYGRAQELLDEALPSIRASGTPLDLINALSASAMLALGGGARDRAHRLLEEAFSLGRADVVTSAVQAMGELVADEGDRRSARRLFEQALDLAHAADDKKDAARALHSLGRLARAEGELKRASVAHQEALALQRQVGDLPGMVISLEAVAGLAAAAGRWEHAARLFGATRSLRDTHGFARHPWEGSGYQTDVELTRECLSVERFTALLSSGAVLSIDEVVTQASKRRRGGKHGDDGWASLTEGEQQAAVLASQGLTNSEIAELLFISKGTVKDHLSRVFSKLEVAGRTELAREIGRREGPPAPTRSLAGLKHAADEP